jgi:alcohol dehydrogenase (cytochrome c)
MKRAIISIGFAACLGVTTMVFTVARAQVPAGPAQQPAGPAPAAPPTPVPASMPASTPLPVVLRNYAPVTAQRLLKPEPENWLMIRGTYDGWGYSPLRQITTANVARLRPVWKFETGETRTHQAAPVVNNGVMFITTPNNQVMALNAKDGTLLWRYHRPRPTTGGRVLHDTNRGVALYGDKVYWAAGEQVLVALDARTGREVWTAKVADFAAGYYANLAPLVANGVVMVGTSGGELGVRGFVAGFDPATGAEKWRTYTIPAPGEPGSETWPKGDQWKTGGGPVWVTGNYDPETNLTYWGTGNGGPWMGDQRPGDNLYISSTIAIDASNGRLKGHFQYTPNESWDWDEASPPILVDFERNGKPVKGLVNVARNGYMYFLERTSGAIRFRDAKPYVRQTVFRGVDPVTGRPDVDPNTKPTTGGPMRTFCPSAHGGKNWPPIAFNPQTRMVYVPANNNLCGSMTGAPVTYTAGQSFAGVQFGTGTIAPGANHFGEVQAWNVDTGQRAWTHTYARSVNWGSMLTTAGGLVFSGGTADRKVHAFDAASGKLLWEAETNSGIVAPPSTFAVDGKQYLAVHTGWGGDSRGMQAQINRLFPGEMPEVPEGGAVWVFAVE